jgi:2-polyprenyl-6-methoxyphenol hydroxylase-like FAD-dependent oxidoreductase
MEWIMLIRLARNWYVRGQDAWKILYDHAIKSGVEVTFGRPISGMNEQPTAVLFEDGSSMEGDLIVGADGTNSMET